MSLIVSQPHTLTTDDFRADMAGNGLEPPPQLVDDGVLRRFKTPEDKSGEKAGWYVLHRTPRGYMWGFYGDWRKPGTQRQWPSHDTVKAFPEAERKAFAGARENARAQHDLKIRQERDNARMRAVRRWDAAAPETGTHPYLQRKGITPTGLRCDSEGLLLVPARDTAGKLHTLQTINPEGEKRFLPGGQVRGHFHTLEGDPERTWVVEGAATGAVIAKVTGERVVVAFSAGNLGPVVRALHRTGKYPGLVVAADNDQWKDPERNPGVEAARGAAVPLGAAVAIPDFAGLDTTGKPTDWHDLYLLAGEAKTREQLAKAVGGAILCREPPVLPTKDANHAEQANQATILPFDRQLIVTDKSSNSGFSDSSERGESSSLVVSPEPEAHSPDGAAPMPTGYFTERGQLFYQAPDAEDDERTWVSATVYATARVRTPDGIGWGLDLTFRDDDGALRAYVMPMELLAGNGDDLRAELLLRGLRVATGRPRALLPRYLMAVDPQGRAWCTDRTGWYRLPGKRDVFVLPDRVLGDCGDDVVRFQQGVRQAPFGACGVQGTATDWAEHVGRYCAGNSRLVFAASCAFAAPLLHLAGLQNGGFHLAGPSSTGKTVALSVACSVSGRPRALSAEMGRLHTWNSTHNGMEGLAAAHNDLLLALDEISEAKPHIIGNMVYMLGNGVGRVRATRTGGAAPRAAWRLLFLSTGEYSLAHYLRSADVPVMAGQLARMPTVPAQASAAAGIFETLHDLPTPGKAAEHLEEQTARYYGAPLQAFLERLTRPGATDTVQERFKRYVDAVRDGRSDHAPVMPREADGQVNRVAARFALVALGGELATEWGLTGWDRGEAWRAMCTCLKAWNRERGGPGASEERLLLEDISLFFTNHGNSRFAPYQPLEDRFGNRIESATRDRAGWHDEKGGGWYVTTGAFTRDVCKNHDPKRAREVLKEHEFLNLGRSSTNSFMIHIPTESRSIRVYHVSKEILNYGNL